MAFGWGKKKFNRPSSFQGKRQTAEELLEQVEELLLRGNGLKALELLEEAPLHVKRSPEFYLTRGTAYGMIGEYYHAVGDLEVALEKKAEPAAVYYNLAMIYTQLDYAALAWQAAEKFLKKRPAKLEGQKEIEEIISIAREKMGEFARKFNISLENYREAALHNEKAQYLLVVGEYKRAMKETEEASRIAQNYVPAQNNRALLHFYTGNLDQAIAEEQLVLEKYDPDNIIALAHMIWFNVYMWERGRAELFAERLKSLLKSDPLEEKDLDRAIEGLGMWEDDQALWDLAVRLGGKNPQILSGLNWYILGAAAANTGHINEAMLLLERAKKLEPKFAEGWIEPALAAVKKAYRTHKPPVGPSLDGRFPYIHFMQLWPSIASEEFLDGMADLEEKEADDDAFDSFFKKYVSRYPYVAYIGKLILWCERDERIRSFSIDLLSASDLPGAHQELFRFATSTIGSDEERMEALFRLTQKGLISPNEKIKFWKSKNGQWQDINSLIFKIEESNNPPCNPKAEEFVDLGREALKAGTEDPKNLKKAEQVLRKALEIDPDCAQALHNLGAVYMMQDRKEEGEHMFRRSVEADPHYLFAYTSLAEMELGRGNFEACKKVLDQILSAPTIPANALIRAIFIQVRLSIETGEIDSARTMLDLLKSLDPDHSCLPELEEYLQMQELDNRMADRWLGYVHKYRQRLLQQPISADEGLVSCLSRISRESLVGALHFWDLPTAGRKADLISKLARVMLDPEFLRIAIQDQLIGEDRQALAWMLKEGGISPWVKFTEQFGDDFDESPYWQWHEPESVPGVLRMVGLLAVGTLDGEQVALIPKELRDALGQILKS